MWLVFIIAFLILFRIGLFFSKTKIIINYIHLSENTFQINGKIILYIFYKFKLLTIIFNENGVKIGYIYISYNKILKNMNVEEFTKKTFKPLSINKIKHLDIVLEKLYVDCNIGTEDLFITVSLVTIISVVFSVILEKELVKKKINGFNLRNRKRLEIDKYRYKIMPVFGKNILLFKGDLSMSFKTRRIGIFLSPKEHTKFKILVGG